MFQNGLSSSPSNTQSPYNGPNFPLISIRDNVNAGYRVITEVFKVKIIDSPLQECTIKKNKISFKKCFNIKFYFKISWLKKLHRKIRL